MKQINKYIIERLHINKDIGKQNNHYNYHPITRDELKELVDQLIKERGNEADLNDIDTLKITNMSELFFKSKFNGDISNWDVSNVESMIGMFEHSEFTGENGDISNWDVSNVKNMSYMFMVSKFNGDISNWDVSNVEYMEYMFTKAEFNGDISKWNVSNVKNMGIMFGNSKFNGDISEWNVSNVKNMHYMFFKSPLEKNPPKWYKE